MASTEEQDHVQASFDVYAQPFVPQALKAVNDAPANIIKCAPVRSIDFDAYLLSFTGRDFADAGRTIKSPRLSYDFDRGHSSPSKRPSGMEDAPATAELGQALSSDSYHDFFAAALKDEYVALQRECDDHALYRVPLMRTSTSVDQRPSMYRVPGLREMSLQIEIGDVVELRQLRFDGRGNVQCGSILKHPDGRPVKLSRHPDTQHDAVVWGINMFNETLSLRVDHLVRGSGLFNVRFTIQRGRSAALWRATLAANESLQLSNQGWLRSILFPEACDGRYQTSLNRLPADLDLYDEFLNYEQLRAVENVLNGSYGPVPYIISGPPGTGKTKTLVELALQLLTMNPASHLLVCAPSDPAADTLIQRLSRHLKPSQLLRLNAPSRSFPEVPNNILAYCCIDDGMFSLPSFGDLMATQIVVTTCRDADILLQARLDNMTLYELERSTHRAIHPSGHYLPTALHWTGILMDEAAQATELEALIPILVVAPPNKHELVNRQLPTYVMAGDQHQLGPRTASKTTTLQTSLFERLLNRPMYYEHPLARSKQRSGAVRPLTQEMLPILRPAFTNLIRNYRSHPAILAVPSQLFYNDTLEPEAMHTDSLTAVPQWKGCRWPILFVSHNGPDEIERDGGGWYNVLETKIACTYAKSFLESGRIEAKDICIMSPFRAQVRQLRRIARQAPFSFPAVNIGPLEAFQGLESRLVILCTTRTRDRFLEQDLAKGLGVIHDPRRFNVALTRAKHGLLVIGNPAVLAQDSNWNTFMAFCHRNGLWEERRTEQWKPSANHTSLPRLEKRLLEIERNPEEEHSQSHLTNRLRTLGIADDYDTSLWRSGTEAAERVLQEELEFASNGDFSIDLS